MRVLQNFQSSAVMAISTAGDPNQSTSVKMGELQEETVPATLLDSAMEPAGKIAAEERGDKFTVFCLTRGYPQYKT